jgi:hypothetical protein
MLLDGWRYTPQEYSIIYRSLMLMMTCTNTASIGLTAHTEAADEAEDEASVHTEGGEEAHTEEVNVMEETSFSRRDAICWIMETCESEGSTDLLDAKGHTYWVSAVLDNDITKSE